MVNRCGLRSECVYVDDAVFCEIFSCGYPELLTKWFAEQIDSLLPYMVTFVKENGDSRVCGGEYSE